MADVFQHVGDAIGGYIQGRYTPVHNKVDPETRAKLLERYVRSLKELSVAEAQIKQEQIQTYGDVTASFLMADAQALSAFADAAAAGAEGAKATAAYAQHMLATDAEMKAAMANRMPNADAVKVASTAAVQAYNAGVSSISVESIDALRKASERGDMADPAAADAADAAFNEGLFSTLTERSGIGTYLANTNAELNRMRPDDAGRVFTAQAMESEAGRAVYNVLAEKERELQSAYGKDTYPDGVLTSRADAYMEQYIRPAFTGQLGEGALNAADQATRAAVMVQDKREAFAESLASKYGIPQQDLQRWRAIQDSTSALVANPVTFANAMSAMPTPIDFSHERKIIRAEMDRLIEGDPDPLEEAVRGMAKAVPAFDSWAAAMRFPSLERAAIYGSRHPGDLTTFMRWHDRDPSIAEDPVRLRGEIAAYGAEQQRNGGEVGYYTKRIERFLGARVTGPGKGAVDANGVRRAPGEAGRDTGSGASPGAFDALPEAADEQAEPGAAANAEAEGTELPVYGLRGQDVRKVSSPFLDTTQPSRVVEMGNGKTYQQLDDGAIVVLSDPMGAEGVTLKPGDAGWLELNKEIVEFHGDPKFSTAGMVYNPEPLVFESDAPQAAPSAPAPPARAAPARAAAAISAALPPGGFGAALKPDGEQEVIDTPDGPVYRLTGEFVNGEPSRGPAALPPGGFTEAIGATGPKRNEKEIIETPDGPVYRWTGEFVNGASKREITYEMDEKERKAARAAGVQPAGGRKPDPLERRPAAPPAAPSPTTSDDDDEEKAYREWKLGKKGTTSDDLGKKGTTSVLKDGSAAADEEDDEEDDDEVAVVTPVNPREAMAMRARAPTDNDTPTSRKG